MEKTKPNIASSLQSNNNTSMKKQLLENLKKAHNQTKKTIKKIEENLSKQQSESKPTKNYKQQEKISNSSNKNQISIQSQQYLRGSHQTSPSTISARIFNEKGRMKLQEPSVICFSDKSDPESNITDQQIDQNQKIKRNIIYEHEAYKENITKSLKTTSQSLQQNNKYFEMIFCKKQNQKISQHEQKIIPKIDKKNQSIHPIKSKKQKQQLIQSYNIQNFTIIKKIGKGKSGHVFLAVERKIGFLCVIKKICKKQMDQKGTIQLLREVKIQTYLNNSHILKLYTFFSDEEFVYLVLEFCTGGDLYNILKKSKKMKQTVVQALIKQVCIAVNYMHQSNVIHRDIKPENILFINGIVKICDFGWSISSTVARQTFCGTPLYVSPQLLTRSNYSNKIDVWGIGILTYELIFGKVPFEIFTEQDLVKIVEDDIIFSKHTTISPFTKNFILSCLQKDPKNRSNVSDLLDHPFLTNQMCSQKMNN